MPFAKSRDVGGYLPFAKSRDVNEQTIIVTGKQATYHLWINDT